MTLILLICALYAAAWPVVRICRVLARWAHHLAHPLRALRVRLGRLAVVAVVLGGCSPAHASPHCGSERATVKLGLDAEAVRLSTEPYDTTVSALVNLPRPGRLPDDRRASDVERMVWRVEATVVAYRAEDDGDIHVAIADSDGHRMIVEIPDPDCAAGGAWGPDVRAAREAFLAMLSARGFPAPARRVRRTAIPVRVGGIGFYDWLHGQSGAARNGLELHPVLSIEVSGGGS